MHSSPHRQPQAPVFFSVLFQTPKVVLQIIQPYTQRHKQISNNAIGFENRLADNTAGRFFYSKCYFSVKHKRRRKQHGGRKLRLNLKAIEGRDLGLIVDGTRFRIGSLRSGQFIRGEEIYRFIFESGYRLDVCKDTLFYHTLLKYENDWLFLEYSKEPVFSGLLAYYLYETCGLPLDFTSDELERNGIRTDSIGFHTLEGFKHETDRNARLDKDAFG